MGAARDPRVEATDERHARFGIDELVAPRRIFKRRPKRGAILALKVVLPVIAVACITYIVIWSLTHKSVINPVEVVADANKQSSDVTVQRVKYEGIDSSNRPFTITAQSADQPQDPIAAPAPSGGEDSNDHVATAAAQPQKPAKPDKAAASNNASNVINLHQLIADMTMVNGAWVAVTADNGVYNRDKGTVALSGDVNLFHDNGLSLQTNAATIDLHNDTASGTEPVEGAHPQGELAADGFQVKDGGATIVFTGHAYLKLYPKSKPANAAGAATGSAKP